MNNTYAKFLLASIIGELWFIMLGRAQLKIFRVTDYSAINIAYQLLVASGELT